MAVKVPKRESYDAVMIFYLIIGAVGLLFFGIALIDELGWLDPVLDAFTAEKENLEQALYPITIIVTFLFGFFLFLGWIPAVWIIFRFRRFWTIWFPSAIFLVIEAVLIATLESEWAMQESFELTLAIAVMFYLASAFGVGVWMLRRRNLLLGMAESWTGDYRGPPQNPAFGA